MIVTISIAEKHLLELQRTAKDSYPFEACALLEGTFRLINSRSNDAQANVHAIIPMRNADESIYFFRIDPNDLIKAYQEISSRNTEVVGIFHSHSSKAYHSATDIKYMQLNPVAWLIYSTLSHRFSAYVLDHRIVQIKLESSSLQNLP